MRFAPTDVGFIADPYRDYEELRRSAPVVYDEATDHWLISRYADVDALLRDRRFGRTYLHTSTHEEMGRPAPPDWHAPFWDLINAGILDMEPPDHTRVRRLVAKAFTPRFVESLRPRVHAILEDLLEGLAGAGEFDLLPTLAEPLPVIVIAQMLGVPEADHHLLRPWSADIVKMYELNPSEPAQHDAVRASLEFSAYLRELARARRTSPGDDLISGLVHVIDEGETLTEDELVGTCVLLLNAGHEATVNATLLGWWALFRHPGSAAGAPRRSLAAPDGDRGAAAVPDAAADVRALGARTVRAPRGRDPEGGGARVAVRLRQSRPGGVRRPR